MAVAVVALCPFNISVGIAPILIATSVVKSYNNILTGKHVSKQTKKTFFAELAKAKANTAKLKSLVIKEDEDNDLF